MAEWVDVGDPAALPPGARTVLDVEGARILVVNLGGQFYAVEDVCTHDGGSLDGGEIEGDEVVCPRHGARFCLKNGAATAPPAYEPIATFPLRLHQGRLQVKDDRWD